MSYCRFGNTVNDLADCEALMNVIVEVAEKEKPEVTIFLGDLRIATNVMTPDNRRAIGTRRTLAGVQFRRGVLEFLLLRVGQVLGQRLVDRENAVVVGARALAAAEVETRALRDQLKAILAEALAQ